MTECARLSECYRKSSRNLSSWQSHQIEQETFEIKAASVRDQHRVSQYECHLTRR